MAKNTVDGVVEAVHYEPDGKVKWVRAYLRRGATYSDRLMIDRQTLIDYLKSGKKIYAGKRIERMASTFEISEPLQVVQSNGSEVLVAGQADEKREHLASVPII